jgi:hypothetical protein
VNSSGHVDNQRPVTPTPLEEAVSRLTSVLTVVDHELDALSDLDDPRFELILDRMRVFPARALRAPSGQADLKASGSIKLKLRVTFDSNDGRSASKLLSLILKT